MQRLLRWVAGLIGLAALLLAFGIGEVNHESVEEACVANEAAKVVVCAAGFTAKLRPCGRGNGVCAGERHLLLL